MPEYTFNWSYWLVYFHCDLEIYDNLNNAQIYSTIDNDITDHIKKVYDQGSVKQRQSYHELKTT